eukprot:CAMPEP_0176503374 /NCGR_PEP_ID=MMETSP0200_2-20121128/15326_1 /TAXON_ID=947934 /ORGANISM="Chaetoceros sp., Strain GSL56" /LENGTH=521 /DNA_ID=CAMNT_0017902655 /DNA_START=128 /DNA_END=1693 /DNA_ORIENTATION=+
MEDMNASGTTTSRRPRVTNAAAGTTSSTTSTGNNIHSTPNAESEDEPPRISRQRRRYLNSMLIVLSPSLIFSKILLISSMILRVGLFPIRKLAYWLFPPGSYDDIASSSASKHAAKVFIEMFHSEYIMNNQHQSSPLANNHHHHYNNNNNNNGEIGNETTSADNDVDGNVMTECPFVENGYVDTIRDIANRGQLHKQNADLNAPPPLLLIYLHAPLHDKVPHFLKNVLCNPRIMSLIHRCRNSGALTCWGGSIHTADGAYARDTLQVSCFPFLALVRVGNQNGSSSNARGSTTTATTTTRNLELLFRMEGPDLQSIQPNALFIHLNNALVKYEAILTEQTMRRLQRQEEVRLREEQDREYREALEADQKREREKQEQQRLKEEEERRIREEQERIAKEKQNRLDNARRILYRNGSGNGSGNGMQGKESLDDLENYDSNIIQARIRLVLPSGKRLERKFRGDDTIDAVRSFLILHFEENDIPIENFELSCNYPKKALTDGEKTLESEGLCPHAVIMVQDLDA